MQYMSITFACRQTVIEGELTNYSNRGEIPLFCFCVVV
jgi:hypothetical protein